ncbi:MAG: hypothetical protein ACRCZI_09810 [Cetobacterium sp.]
MSLKNLLALQAKKQNSETPATAKLADSTPAPPPSPVEAESPESVVEDQVASAKPKGLGLNLAGANKAIASKPVAPKVVESTSDFSLEDLASMDAGSVDVVESSSEDPMFPDEIEATAPDRELPADITEEQLAFVDSLNGIYGVLHDSDMFGQTVRMIMIELQENPEYDKLLSDSDVHTMIRGMRRTMGLARVRKQEKSRKAGTNKNARKSAGVSDGAMALLDSLMGGGDD